MLFFPQGKYYIWFFKIIFFIWGIYVVKKKILQLKWIKFTHGETYMINKLESWKLLKIQICISINLQYFQFTHKSSYFKKINYNTQYLWNREEMSTVCLLLVPIKIGIVFWWLNNKMHEQWMVVIVFDSIIPSPWLYPNKIIQQKQMYMWNLWAVYPVLLSQLYTHSKIFLFMCLSYTLHVDHDKSFHFAV